MDKQEQSVVPEQEEEGTSFSIKNLISRLVCIAALAYGLKYLLDKGQLLFAAFVAVCTAGFILSLIMYISRVIKEHRKNKKK
ncbi:MAG: hypothetical protein IJU96_11305 [Clostridia bacterium]|nr:hypothetical protein [Clostridia bacterium]